MEITRRTDYALRLIAILVENQGNPLSVREAATAQEVPYAFARSIQHDLVLAGLVTSVRGAAGGMLLACDPQKLTLLDLIEAVQGQVSVSICATEEDWCSREKKCSFHPVWEGANILLKDYFSSVSIKELIDGCKAHLNNETIDKVNKNWSVVKH